MKNCPVVQLTGLSCLGDWLLTVTPPLQTGRLSLPASTFPESHKATLKARIHQKGFVICKVKVQVKPRTKVRKTPPITAGWNEVFRRTANTVSNSGHQIPATAETSQTQLRDKDYLRGFLKEKTGWQHLKKPSLPETEHVHSQAPFINNTENNKKSITK